MTEEDSLEDLLDRGLEAISQGQTIDEFLARQSSNAKALKPLLLQSEALRRGFAGEPRPEAVAATRDTLLRRYDELRDSGTIAASRSHGGRFSLVLLGSLAACLLLALVSTIAHVDSARPAHTSSSLVTNIDSFQVPSQPQSQPSMLINLQEANRNAAELGTQQTPAQTEGPATYATIIELTQKILSEARKSGVSESIAIQLRLLADQEAKLGKKLLSSQRRDTTAVGERLLSLANELVRLSEGLGQSDKGADQKQSTTPQPSRSREAEPPLMPVASDVAVAPQSMHHSPSNGDTNRGSATPSNSGGNAANNDSKVSTPGNDGSNTASNAAAPANSANTGGNNGHATTPSNVGGNAANNDSKVSAPGNSRGNAANNDSKVSAPNNGGSNTANNDSKVSAPNNGGGNAANNDSKVSAPNNGGSNAANNDSKVSVPNNGGSNTATNAAAPGNSANTGGNNGHATTPSNGGGNAGNEGGSGSNAPTPGRNGGRSGNVPAPSDSESNATSNGGGKAGQGASANNGRSTTPPSNSGGHGSSR